MQAASDGYSAFTTRYLERLSQSANISLQATNNINLDLKGDTLALASNRDLTLTAGNNISTASTGAIQTSGTGAILLSAGNDISFTHDMSFTAVGGAGVQINAGRDILVDAPFSGTAVGYEFNAGRHITINDPITTSAYIGAFGSIRLAAAGNNTSNTGLLTINAAISNAGYFGNIYMLSGHNGAGVRPNYSVSATSLSLVDGGKINITLLGFGSLSIDQPMSVAHTITLSADDLDINASLTSVDPRGITLTASDDLRLNLSGGSISGHDLTLTAGDQITTGSAGAMTTNNGAISLTAAGGIQLNHALGLTTGTGNLTLSSPVSLAASQSWNAGTGTFTSTGSIAAGANDLTVTADDVTLGGNVTGTGTLTLQPYSTTRSVRLNLGAGDFNLDSSELAYIQDGWSQINIGRIDAGNGSTMHLGASTWNDPVAFRGSSSAWGITQSGALTGLGNASFSFYNSYTQIINDITTQGGAVNFYNGAYTTNYDNKTITTNGGAIRFSAPETYIGNHLTLQSGGGDISFAGPVKNLGLPNTYNLTINAGSGAVSFGSSIDRQSSGASGKAVNTLTVNAGSLSFNGLINANAVTLTSGSSTTLPTIYASSINASTTAGDLSGAGGLFTSGGNVTLSAANDLNLLGMGLITDGGNVTLSSGRDTYLSTAISTGTGDLTVSATRDLYLIKNHLTTGLLAWYKFDEGSGTSAADSSGNGNTGTLTNGPTWSASSPYGLAGDGSLSFDGVNDFVASSPAIGPTATFSMWATAPAGNPMLFALAPGAPGPDLFFFNGKISWNTYNGDTNAFGSIPASAGDGRFHHYVTVVSPGSTRLYYDGVLLGTAAYADPTSNVFQIGGQPAYQWLGNIDNVRVYNSALSASDVQKLYAPEVSWSTGTTSLTAGRNVSVDVKGDTLALSSGKNLTVTATNDLSSASAGTIQTSGTGGILLSAGNDVNLTHDLDLTASGTGAVTLRANNSILSSGSGDITTQGGAITLNSDRDASGAGAISLGSGTALTSNGGDITLGGGDDPDASAAYGTAGNMVGVNLSGATIAPTTGAVIINGGGFAGNPALSELHGIVLTGGASILSTGTGAGNITLNGVGGDGTSLNYGVYLAGGSVSSGYGDISITGRGGNGSSFQNVGFTINGYAGGTIASTGTGANAATISIQGFGGTSLSNDNRGIDLLGGTISSVDGAISLTGVAGTGPANNNSGIVLHSNSDVYAQIVSTGIAPISITGVGGLGGGTNQGIVSIIDYGTGSSSLIGGAASTGNITLTADSFATPSLSLQTTGTVTLQPYTSSAAVGIAGSAGTLQVTSSFLDNIAAGTVTIGRSDGTGLLRVGAYDASARNWDLSLITGTSSVQFNGNLSLGSNNLSVSAGDVSVGANLSGTGNLSIYGPGSIVIGADSPGNLSLNGAEVGRLVDGWNQITIGSADSFAPVLFSGSLTWADPLVVDAHYIQIQGNQSATGNGAFAFNSRYQTDMNNATVATAGGNVAITGGLHSYNGATVSAATGNVTVTGPTHLSSDLALAGGAISLTGAVNGAHALTVTGTSISLGADIGGTTPLGAVSLTSAGGLTLPSISATSILARTTGTTSDLTVAAGKTLTASGAGTAITLASGRNFLNNAGAGALSTPSGRWLVYSSSPAADTLGGLTSAFRRFSCSYGGSCPSVPGSGNGSLYSATPVLTARPVGLTLTAGAPAPNLAGYTYTLTGYLGGDALVDSVTGSLNGSTPYVPGRPAGTYAIDHASGALTSAMGYGFAYASNPSGVTVRGPVVSGREVARIVTAQPAVLPPIPAAPVVGALAPSADGHQRSFQDAPPLERPSKPIYNLLNNRLVVDIDPSLQWFFNVPPRL